MSDDIVRELPSWFVDRMREWARSILFPDGSDVPSSWPSDGPMNDSTGVYRSRAPRMLGRAHDTDAALDDVQGRYAWAVRQFWLFEGRSLREHSRARGINHETFGAWVRKGHERLMEIFPAQREKRQRDLDGGAQAAVALDIAVPPKYDARQY